MIQIGQSEEEVVAAIGDPDERLGSGPSERWFYNVISNDQKSCYPYTADFENGKLVRWYFDSARIDKHSSQQSRGGKKSRGAGPNEP